MTSTNKLIAIADAAGYELRSKDGSNIFALKQIAVLGQTYDLGCQFCNPSPDFLKLELADNSAFVKSLIVPFDPEELAVLEGEHYFKASLAEVVRFIGDLELRPLSRLWIRHLGNVARLDGFMGPQWYCPEFENPHQSYTQGLRQLLSGVRPGSCSVFDYGKTMPKYRGFIND